MSDDKQLKEEIEAALWEAADKHPGAAFTRDQFAIFSGVSTGYLANLDSRGKGPEGTFYNGNKRMYLKGPGVKWNIDRVRVKP